MPGGHCVFLFAQTAHGSLRTRPTPASTKTLDPMLQHSPSTLHPPPFSLPEAVEVSGEGDDGFAGSWYEARVVRSMIKRRCYFIVYETLLDDVNASLPLREVVGAGRLRPRPPLPAAGDREFVVGCAVDAAYNDGWWSGVVISVPGEGEKPGRYGVKFAYTDEVMEFRAEELRPQLRWVDGEWLPVKPQDEYTKWKNLSKSNSDDPEEASDNGNSADDNRNPVSSMTICLDKDKDQLCDRNLKRKPTRNLTLENQLESCYSGKKMNADIQIPEADTTTKASPCLDIQKVFTGSRSTVINKCQNSLLMEHNLVNCDTLKEASSKAFSGALDLLFSSVSHGTTDTLEAGGGESGIISNSVSSYVRRKKCIANHQQLRGDNSPRNMSGGEERTKRVVHPRISLIAETSLSQGDLLQDSSSMVCHSGHSKNAADKLSEDLPQDNSSIACLAEDDKDVVDKLASQPLFTVEIETQGESCSEANEVSPDVRSHPCVEHNVRSRWVQDHIQHPGLGCDVVKEVSHQNAKTGADLSDNSPFPFAKCSPLWESIGSMWGCSKMPQKPHFRPLEQQFMDLREGMAIGLVAAYHCLVDSIKKLRISDSQDMFSGKLKALSLLEEHGFYVQHLRSQLEELLKIKLDIELLQKEKTSIEQMVVDKQNVKAQLHSYMGMIEQAFVKTEQTIKDMEQTLNERKLALGQLCEKNSSIREQMQNNDSEIDKLQGDARRIEEALLSADQTFKKALCLE